MPHTMARSIFTQLETSCDEQNRLFDSGVVGTLDKPDIGYFTVTPK